MTDICNAHSKSTVDFKIIKTLKTPKWAKQGLFTIKTIKHKAEYATCGQKLGVTTDYEDYNDVIYCWIR